MIYFKKNHKILIGVIVVVLFIFFIERFFASGLRSRLKILSQKIRLAEGNLRKGRAIQKTKDIILQDYKDAQPYLEAAEKFSQQIDAELLKETERIISLTGGSVVNLNPQPIAAGTKVCKADFRFEMSFSQLLNFLYELQESKLFIKADRLVITSKDKESTLLRVDGVLSMSIF